jgi:hypothetical protein
LQRFLSFENPIELSMHIKRQLILGLVFLFVGISQINAQWYLNEPVRLLQTNLPMHKVPEYKADALVQQVLRAKANTWLFNVGGIYAYYPTTLEDHTINPFMDPSRDFVGELMTAAEKNDIRVIGRFDFSRFPTRVAARHPDWCFRRTDGSTVTFNDVTTSCINGPFYQDYAFRIVDEALSRYKISGLLVNWWGNHPRNGYVDQPNGVCHCDNCKTKWAKEKGKPLPDDFTEEYVIWHDGVRRDLEKRMQLLVDKYNTDAPLIIYHQTGGRDQIEGFTVETKTGDLNNKWWLFESSYFVNKYRNSHPDKGTFNTVVNFLNYNYRFSPHRTGATEARMLQSMAHGALPAIYLIGMPEELDTSGPQGMYLPFATHQKNETHYVGQRQLAKVALIDDGLTDQMKGLVNILSENHVPYSVFTPDKVHLIPDETELIISTQKPNDEIMKRIENGCNLLSIGAEIPGLFDDLVIKEIDKAGALLSYWAVESAEILKNTAKHQVIGNMGPYVLLKEDATSDLQLIPPAMNGPPERVWNDVSTSDIPGMAHQTHGKGQAFWIPWNAGELYFQHGTGSLSDLVMDLTNHLSSQILTTDAHPLVETSLMINEKTGTRYLHMINHTGQLHGSGSRVIPMDKIAFKLAAGCNSVTKASDGNP